MTSEQIIQAIRKQKSNDLASEVWPTTAACGNREMLFDIREAARFLREDIALMKMTDPSNWSCLGGKREIVDELSYALASLADHHIEELSEEDVQACLDGALVMCFSCSGAGLPYNYLIDKLEKRLIGPL